ncbi:MAG TPA: phosphoglycolate phosphatase, partial [Clostridiales bacterium]|nr:phosphoglycolate phosphatase [Clostridiales bacterium]
IAKYFTFIAGSTLDGSRVKKGDVIRYALESCNIIDGSQAIMIGDREHDIIGAKEMGLSSIGVLFGYGSRAELEEAGADFIVSTIEDIGKVILAK